MENENPKTAEPATQETETSDAQKTRARYIKYAILAFLGFIILSAWAGAYMVITAPKNY